MATILRRIEPLAETLATMINALKAQAGARCFIGHKEAPDAAAGTATAERVIYVAGEARTFKNIGIVPSAALTADANNRATITLARKDADGTNSVTLATLVTDVAGGSWAAFVRKSMGALTNATFAAGQQMTLTIAKAGTGVVVPSFEIDDTPSHLDQSEVTITAANATDLTSSLTLVNQMRAVQLFHRADTLAHKIADAAAITAPAATDLATAQTLANELKADHNTHIALMTVHYAVDGLDGIATADASDQNSLNTLLNAMKTAMNAHFGMGPPAASIRLVDA